MEVKEMDKLRMSTKDIAEDNIEKIGQLFPECLTEIIDEEGKTKRAIDFAVLNKLFNCNVINYQNSLGGGILKECYQFTWPDKSKARAIVNKPINATLRPCREESVNFDTTENLYIEGDNLDVLKLLRETYYGKVKMIYIDPPYNTGNDFVYEDDFSQNADTYKANSGQYDNQGNRLQRNQETNGRFHTDWLNMMYPRLKIARDLLSDDGAIFLSIDENEQTNLKKLCEELFGEENKVAEFIIIRAEGGGMAKQVIKGHDYLFVYAKDISSFVPLGKPKDIRGKIVERDGEKFWIQEDWLRKEFGKYGNCHYEEILEYKGQGKLDEINTGLANGKYILLPKSNGMNIVGKLRNVNEDSSKFYSILKHLSAKGIDDLKSLELDKFFSYPKPVSLLTEIISGMTLFTGNNRDIILDFFSGSATTAHAVMQLNAEDGGNRKFIMVQLAEACAEGSEAYKAGYKNICEIGKERIRRAGKKILGEQKNKAGDLFSQNNSELDVGFRVLKLNSSNMEDVYYTPDELKQGELAGLISNIKEGRTDEDLLFQVMLDLGVLLSSKIEVEVINGKKVFNVNKGYLMACFDEDVDEGVITAVAKKEPNYFVMRDSSLANDSVSVNFDQIFEKYSKDTKRKVL